MRTFSLSVAVSWLLWAPVYGSHAQEASYYTFEMDGHSIGAAEITADEVSWDGRPLKRLRSTTTLKFALMGTTRTTVRRSTTLVDPQDNSPVHFELTQTVNGVVSHIESRFDGQHVRTWQWAEGAEKGEPQETPCEPGTRVLGSNDFAHWNLITRALAGAGVEPVVTCTVFLPDSPQTQTFRLVRGDTRSQMVLGVERECRTWSLEGAGIEILTDADTGQLLEMNIPAQRTQVKVAAESALETAEQAAAPEILTRHFTQSNVMFDDFMAVRMLEAKIQVTVIGTGPANDPSVLLTAEQQFDGTKDGASIEGTVIVRSRSDRPAETIPFPGSVPADSACATWLSREPLIESDDPAIVSMAKELTRNVSSRWQAVEAIADWVHREIRYALADSPSARMALERRRGDCGPHATLTVAMLRAVGIPARLVGGLVYTPSFGGSFGQHAWVEVSMGADGWVALDPTTGEIESLSATHIKLFEGMGGVIPQQVEVIEYEPKNRELATPDASIARPLAWKLDQDYTYVFVQNGQRLGTETFRIRQVIQDDQRLWEVADTLDLTAAAGVRSTTRLVTLPNAIPVSFDREFTAQGTTVTRQCRFRDQQVSVQVGGAVQSAQELRIPSGTYCFDNNLIASFALICSQLDWREDSTIDIRTFHPTSSSVINLAFQIKRAKTIRVGDVAVECFECFVEPIKNTFWITRDGRLLKVEAAGLTIEVSPLE